jgi:hypothetical protein
MILDILTVLFFVLGFVLILWMIGERRRDVLYGPYVATRMPVHKPGRGALSVTAKYGNVVESGSAASAMASAAFRTLRLSGPCNRAVRRAAETIHATIHMPKMLYGSQRLNGKDRRADGRSGSRFCKNAGAAGPSGRKGREVLQQ